MESYEIVEGNRSARQFRLTRSITPLESLLKQDVCDAIILTSSHKHRTTIIEYIRPDHAYLILSSDKKTSSKNSNAIRVHYPSRRHGSYRPCKSAIGHGINVYVGTIVATLLFVGILYFVTKIYTRSQQRLHEDDNVSTAKR